MEQNQPRWPFAIFFGLAAALFIFGWGGQFFWKALNAFQIWPVAEVDGWFSFIWKLYKAPRGTLAALHSNFQLRFYIPTAAAGAAALAVSIWSARAQEAAGADRHVRGRRYLTGKKALGVFTSHSLDTTQATPPPNPKLKILNYKQYQNLNSPN